MTRLFWICLGGFIGTGARYLLAGWVARRFGAEFPYGTLAVNVLGSLVLGFLMWISVHTVILTPTVRLALTTGGMGGFTTYSTFNYETLRFLQERAWLLATVNVGVTVITCMIAGFLGWTLGGAIVGR